MTQGKKFRNPRTKYKRSKNDFAVIFIALRCEHKRVIQTADFDICHPNERKFTQIYESLIWESFHSQPKRPKPKTKNQKPKTKNQQSKYYFEF